MEKDWLGNATDIQSTVVVPTLVSLALMLFCFLLIFFFYSGGRVDYLLIEFPSPDLGGGGCLINCTISHTPCSQEPVMMT